jgi:transcriptional regulator with XRE-family HTH domain
MEMISAVRQNLGISQEYLAILLGVKRSLLEKAEKGLRQLPGPALLKLLQLYEAIPSTQLPNAIPKKSTELPPKLPELLEGLQQWSVTQSAYYKNLANEIRIRHHQASNCLAVFPAFAANEPPGEETRAALVLRILKAESEQQLKKYPLELASKCGQMATLLHRIATDMVAGKIDELD